MEGKGTVVGFQHTLERVNSNTANKCIVPIADLPASFRFEIDKGYSTGWRCLDKYLHGIRKGELTVITADTGSGKTTFCTQMMVNCAMQGVPVWINSWEMRPEIVMRKIASVALRKPMKMQNFTELDNANFDEWCSLYCIYVNPHTIGINIVTLGEQLRAAKEIGVQVVMIDHLDYLVNMRRDKIYEAIDETVKALHEMAFDLSMHLFLICHPRQSSTSTDEIGIHSLKGSSSIKQYADNVIILHRCSRTDPQSDPNKVKVRIAKNRMFGTEGITYLFYQPLWDGYVEFRDL